MSLLKLIVPAAAVVSVAYAQSSCSTSGTLTVTNTADVVACSTYTGSIAIATDATDISLPMTRITQDLVTVPGGMLNSLEAPDLSQVDGMMSINGLANIASLSMPSIASVNMFQLEALGSSLLSLDFGTPGLRQVANFTIADTYLRNFNGINLQTAESFTVATNQLLNDLTLQELRNVTGMLAIRGNNRGLNVNLPALTSAGSVLMNDCSEVSIPKLQNVTTTFALQMNSFETLSLPNMTQVGPGQGGFNVNGNPQLTNLTTPRLARIAGGLDIQNNTKLGGTLSFPSLTLAGSAAFTGMFTDVTLPKLEQLKGLLTLASTKNIMATCSRFQSNQAVSKVRCSSAQPSQSQKQTTASSTANAALHYGTSPEAAFGIFGALAALFGLFM